MFHFISEPASNEETLTDYQMDLLRALEMSRLQFLREMGSLRPGSDDRSPRSPRSPLLSPSQVSSPGCLHPGMSPTTASSSHGPSPVPGTSGQLVLCEPPRGRPNRKNLASSEGTLAPNQKEMTLDLNGEYTLVFTFIISCNAQHSISNKLFSFNR
jgi:hypothetical protein